MPIRASFQKFNNYKYTIKSYYLIFTLLFFSKKFLFLNSNFKIKITILPLKYNKYTFIRAPMAHKTKSHEQFKFKRYKLNFSFESCLNLSIYSINYALFFVLVSFKNFPNIETNLFFLKKVNCFFFFSDLNFFKY